MPQTPHVERHFTAGAAIGDAGQYGWLTGRVYFAFDPTNRYD